MKVQIYYHRQFLKDLKRLAKKYKSLKEDFAQLLASLEENPNMGSDLGRGLRKVRVAITAKGKGKSGGARVITYSRMQIAPNTYKISLLTIYDKSEMDNISDAFIQYLVSTIDATE